MEIVVFSVFSPNSSPPKSDRYVQGRGILEKVIAKPWAPRNTFRKAQRALASGLFTGKKTWKTPV
jgi:hypothetical protein